jgi:hypothetical protein
VLTRTAPALRICHNWVLHSSSVNEIMSKQLIPFVLGQYPKADARPGAGVSPRRAFIHTFATHVLEDGVRQPNGSGTAGALRHQDHHDLHPCAQPRSGRRPMSDGHAQGSSYADPSNTPARSWKREMTAVARVFSRAGLSHRYRGKPRPITRSTDPPKRS